MKRLVFLALLLAVPVCAQVSNPPGVQYKGSAPSGSCAQVPPIQVVNSTGTIYTCSNGIWAAQTRGTSGTGTTGFLPVWTSANAQGNSHIDDGVTTTATLTATEPITSTTATSGALTVNATSGSTSVGFGINVYNSGSPLTNFLGLSAINNISTNEVLLTVGGNSEFNIYPADNPDFTGPCQGCIGINTASPDYPLDVYGPGSTAGKIDAGGSGGGYAINGTATSGHYLRGNGTLYVDSALVAGDITTAIGSTTYDAYGTAAARSVQASLSTGPFTFGGSAVNTVIAQTIAAQAGHFTNLVITSSLGGSCTTAPTFNVFDGTSSTGTAKLATSTTQTKGTATSQTQTLTFAAGDLIGIYISSAGATCTTDTWTVSAQYSTP